MPFVRVGGYTYACVSVEGMLCASAQMRVDRSVLCACVWIYSTWVDLFALNVYMCAHTHVNSIRKQQYNSDW